MRRFLSRRREPRGNDGSLQPQRSENTADTKLMMFRYARDHEGIRQNSIAEKRGEQMRLMGLITSE